MNQTPTNQQHTSDDMGKASASDSSDYPSILCWNEEDAFYNSDLSLGSLTAYHIKLIKKTATELQSLHYASLFSDHPRASLPLLASPPAPPRRYQPRQPLLGVVAPRATKQKNKNSSFPLMKKGKSETITPPYEWATNRRATVHSLDSLYFKNIHEITGDVQCRRCESKYQIGFNLVKSFTEVAKFIWENKCEMADRAPDVWMNPTLPTCRYCGQENSVKPVIPRSKKAINWLFLLLGQMLGCCTLDQLRYFCKYRRHHRTGAKDRVLYLTYLNLCKQLDPNGPFDR
nr:Hydroxyproline-rich glycoprotein family protein [Ipomoea batatas]